MKLLIIKTALTTTLISASIAIIGCEKPASTAEATPPSTTSEAKPVEKPAEKPEKKKTGTMATLPKGVADLPKSDPIPVDVSSVNLTASKPSTTNSSATDVAKPDFNLDTSALKDVSKTKKDKSNNQTEELAEQVVTLTPATLDLGQFSTSEKGSGSVTLTNTSDSPVTIERAKASCGCTTSDFKQGTVLQPGETTDVSVTMNGKGRARKMSKTVTFTISGFPPLRLPVVAETIAYVALDKDPITIAEDDGISTITLSSVDNQPFTVTSILPAIAVELPTEPSATHEIQIDW